MKKLSVFLLVLLMCVCTFVNASAATDPIDLNQRGSLYLTFECSHGYKSDGNVALYYVAELIWTGTEYKFEYTEDFKDCNLSLDSQWDETYAKRFSDYVVANQIVVDRNIINDDGVTSYENLPLGLYLVVHEEPTNGFSPALPFLITVPVSNGDGWEYKVDASPKLELTHGEISYPPDIPQTGQLKWPIPVLISSGVIIFAIGLVLCFKRSEN